MRFYTKQHVHYCGIDLHARGLYLCILDSKGEVLVHRQLPCDRDKLLKTLSPYREDLAVAVECLFCWYWVAGSFPPARHALRGQISAGRGSQPEA